MDTPEKKDRRSIRLPDCDYSEDGAYYITFCTHLRRCIFGCIEDNAMLLNEAGEMVQSKWRDLSERFEFVELDEFVVMPNHIHGIIVINQEGDHKDRPYRESCNCSPEGTPPASISRIVQAYKSITTNEYISGVRKRGWPPFPKRLWQRNYFDRVIRNNREWSRAIEYIRDNPFKWEKDSHNPVQKERQ